MEMKRHILVALSIILFASTAIVAQKQNQKEIANAAETSQKATRALDQIMSITERSIPTDLLRKAKAVCVFPGVLKGAFIVGWQAGKGLISRRIGKGWGPPALFKLGGGSVGFQIGGSSTDVVMLFMTDDSVRKPLED